MKESRAGLEEQDHGKIYPRPEQYAGAISVSCLKENLTAPLRRSGPHMGGERGKDAPGAISSQSAGSASFDPLLLWTADRRCSPGTSGSIPDTGSSDRTIGWALSLPWSAAVLPHTVAPMSSLCPSRRAEGWHFGSGFGC